MKEALGGGYGTHRHVSGEKAHVTTKPALRNVTVHPGPGKQMPGGTKMKHFQGATIKKAGYKK